MAEHDGHGRSGLTPIGPRQRTLVWCGASFLLLLLLLVAIRLGGDTLYDYPANPAPLAFPPDTVIVTLAGGKHRLEAAFELYAAGVGDQLWIIGAGKHANLNNLVRTHAGEVMQKMPWDRLEKVQIENESRNTIENAFAVKRLLDHNPTVKNLVLVTSPYHMRRSMLMIEHHISPEINLIPFTPIAADFGGADWWHSWFGISLTIAETIKFELARLLIPHLSYF